jgi:hypothetical protein
VNGEGSVLQDPRERLCLRHNPGAGVDLRTAASSRGAGGHRGRARRGAAHGGVNAAGYLVRDLTLQAEDVAGLPVVAPRPEMLV